MITPDLVLISNGNLLFLAMQNHPVSKKLLEYKKKELLLPDWFKEKTTLIIIS